MLRAKRLPAGGAIGLFCPCHVADRERYERIIFTIKGLGYKVKLGENFYKDTYGYAASAEERAADLNGLVADPEVGMVLFSGGEGAAEILPLIDYENIRRNPKLFSSYSDGTSILNAVHAQTGLVTYYGCGAGEFSDLRQYDYEQFLSHFAAGHEAKKFINGGKWKTLKGGACEGALIGGFSLLFGLFLGGKYFTYDPDKKYLLFLEDHEKYSKTGAASEFLAFIEHSPFFRNVTGLLFGHYAVDAPEELLNCLARFGERNNIPVAYTDDFGHGIRHAVLPIGERAALDTDAHGLEFL